MGSLKDIVKRRLLKVERMLNKNKLPFFARNTIKMEKPKIRNISLLRFKKYETNGLKIYKKREKLSKWKTNL